MHRFGRHVRIHVVHACSLWSRRLPAGYSGCGCFCWTNLCALSIRWMNLGLFVVSWDDSPPGYGVDRITGTNLDHEEATRHKPRTTLNIFLLKNRSIEPRARAILAGLARARCPDNQIPAALPAEESRCSRLVPGSMASVRNGSGLHAQHLRKLE